MPTYVSSCSWKNAAIAFGAIGTALTFGYLPLYFRNRHQRLNKSLVASEKPLTGSQVMRGPYMNVGSKDVGRDPDWDFKSGLYKGQSPLALIQSPYDRPTENPMKESVKKIVENADQ